MGGEQAVFTDGYGGVPGTVYRKGDYCWWIDAASGLRYGAAVEPRVDTEERRLHMNVAAGQFSFCVARRRLGLAGDYWGKDLFEAANDIQSREMKDFIDLGG